MAIQTISITGKVLAPNGVAPTSGTVTAQLSQPARALDGTESDWLGGKVTVPLGAGGALTMSLAANASLVPTGTVYEVKFNLVMASGAALGWTEYWSLSATPTTIDVGAITRVSQMPGVLFVAGPAGVNGASVTTYDVAARPTAAAGLVNQLIAVTESGQPTLLQVCLPNGDGSTFKWVTLGQSD